ncbi:hypothetical protein LXL04_023137 [Taraxacum kok-saghyz]
MAAMLDPDPDPTQFHIQLRPDAASFPPPSFDSTGNFSIFFTPFSSLSPFDRLHFSGVQVASTPSRSISSTGDFRYLHRRPRQNPVAPHPIRPPAISAISTSDTPNR